MYFVINISVDADFARFFNVDLSVEAIIQGYREWLDTLKTSYLITTVGKQRCCMFLKGFKQVCFGTFVCFDMCTIVNTAHNKPINSQLQPRCGGGYRA